MNQFLLPLLAFAFNASLQKQARVPHCFCCKYADMYLYVFFLAGKELPEVVVAETKSPFVLIGSEARIIHASVFPYAPFPLPIGEPVITTSSPIVLMGKQRNTVKRVDTNTYQIL